jgi:predicted TIM-barrel enzyme
MQYKRDEVVKRLRDTLSAEEPIIAAGAGTGISAKFTEKGGADLIVIYNSGRYRMTGYTSWAGLLPIGDANEIVLKMGEHEVLPIVKEAPVIAGVFASDPTREMSHFLKKVKDLGFSGVINFPTVGVLEGQFRDNLESTGLGFQREVDLIRLARQMDLFTMAYVFDEEQATNMAEVGVNIVVAHMGNSSGGTVGQDKVVTLDQTVQLIQKIADAARKINPDVIVLCHGGPIALPNDASYVFENTNIEGFVGASSLERIPIEKPLEEATHAFKSLRIRKNNF